MINMGREDLPGVREEKRVQRDPLIIRGPFEKVPEDIKISSFPEVSCFSGGIIRCDRGCGRIDDLRFTGVVRWNTRVDFEFGLVRYNI